MDYAHPSNSIGSCNSSNHFLCWSWTAQPILPPPSFELCVAAKVSKRALSIS